MTKIGGRHCEDPGPDPGEAIQPNENRVPSPEKSALETLANVRFRPIADIGLTKQRVSVEEDFRLCSCRDVGLDDGHCRA